MIQITLSTLAAVARHFARQMFMRPTFVAEILVAGRTQDVIAAGKLLQSHPAVRTGLGSTRQGEMRFLVGTRLSGMGIPVRGTKGMSTALAGAFRPKIGIHGRWTDNLVAASARDESLVLE